MNEARIKWTAFAAKELDAIFNYIANESQSNKIASDFINSVFQRTEQLKIMPLSGQFEPYLKEHSVRYIIAGNYKIQYTYRNNTIFITDIFHTKRNPDKMKNIDI